MAIIIKLAKNQNLFSKAHKLVRKTYLQTFNMDIDELHFFHPEKFKSDVLLAISADNNEILGTMSIMYPNLEGIYPCESLFGFELSKYHLANNNYVEIGRFATSDEGKKKVTVVIALFLGAIKYLQNQEVNGWTATVKDDVYDFLHRVVSLPLNNIAQKPIIQENDPLKSYVGNANSLHLFDVSLNETAFSFKRFEGYLKRGLIDLQIS